MKKKKVRRKLLEKDIMIAAASKRATKYIASWASLRYLLQSELERTKMMALDIKPTSVEEPFPAAHCQWIRSTLHLMDQIEEEQRQAYRDAYLRNDDSRTD